MPNSSKVSLQIRFPESALLLLLIVAVSRIRQMSSIKSPFRDIRKSLVMLLPLMQRLSKTKKLLHRRIEMLQ